MALLFLGLCTEVYITTFCARRQSMWGWLYVLYRRELLSCLDRLLCAGGWVGTYHACSGDRAHAGSRRKSAVGVFWLSIARVIAAVPIRINRGAGPIGARPKGASPLAGFAVGRGESTLRRCFRRRFGR